MQAATGETHGNEVVAGDLVIVKLDRIPTVPVQSVSLGAEATAEILQISGGSLVVRVPVTLGAGTYPVLVTLAGQDKPLLSQAVLAVYPPPNAAVMGISPKRITTGSPVKVTGSGFLAPKEKVFLYLNDRQVEVDRVAPDGSWFTAVIPPNEVGGQKRIAATVWGAPASLPDEGLNITVERPVNTAQTVQIALYALIPLLLAGGLIYLLYRTSRKRLSWLAALLYEPENDTYSLSRAQFFWWLLLIAYAYLFLMVGRGVHEDNWGFPPLSGFAYTFLISLGTLVAAEATSAAKGAKGAGVVHPAPSDLIVHGGVLAPERVQQVVWSLLAGAAFLWITIRTYATATALPTIPNELLVLMGVSSAGYLAGKMARKPGPIIKQVIAAQGSVLLKIYGIHLSRNASVLVDDVPIPQDAVSVLESDPRAVNEFARALQVRLPEEVTLSDWQSKEHTLIVFNADGQRAEWESPDPAIVAADLQQDAKGEAVLTLTGEGIAAGASLEVGGRSVLSPLTPDPRKPGRWQATIEGGAETLKSPLDIAVVNPSGHRGTYRWTPPAG